ncbi:MAG: damage-inducible protein CinA, partial [Actinomycetota bacterium]
MFEMFERAILPDLLARSGEASIIKSRVLRTWGDSESGLNERLVGVIDELEKVGNPTLAFLASGWEGIKVRLTAKAHTVAEAEKLLAVWEAKVREKVGDIIFGVDQQNMEFVILDALRKMKLTLG